MTSQRRYDYYVRDRKGAVIRHDSYLADPKEAAAKEEEARNGTNRRLAEKEESELVAELRKEIKALERRVADIEARGPVPTAELERRIAAIEARPMSSAPAKAGEVGPSPPDENLMELARIVQDGFDRADKHVVEFGSRLATVEDGLGKLAESAFNSAERAAKAKAEGEAKAEKKQ